MIRFHILILFDSFFYSSILFWKPPLV